MSKIVKNVKKINNKHCYISNDSLSEITQKKADFVIKLNCGHCFSYSAFIKSYIINMDSPDSHNKCPYCLSTIKNIPIIINKYLKKKHI